MEVIGHNHEQVQINPTKRLRNSDPAFAKNMAKRRELNLLVGLVVENASHL
jgi:hypothetical protein